MGKKGKRARKAKAKAGAWNAAVARAPATIIFAGATGGRAHCINGAFDRVPAERAPGGAPVYKRRTKEPGGKQPWLFLASNDKWIVGEAEDKDTRKATGWACTVAAVANGTLPPEATAGGWQVDPGGDDRLTLQLAVTVVAEEISET